MFIHKTLRKYIMFNNIFISLCFPLIFKWSVTFWHRRFFVVLYYILFFPWGSAMILYLRYEKTGSSRFLHILINPANEEDIKAKIILPCKIMRIICEIPFWCGLGHVQLGAINRSSHFITEACENLRSLTSYRFSAKPQALKRGLKGCPGERKSPVTTHGWLGSLFNFGYNFTRERFAELKLR